MAAPELTLEALGLDQEKLAEKLVDRLAQNMLTSIGYDEDGSDWFGTSPFARKLNDMVKARLDQVVNDLADKHVLPRVEAMVEGLVLQQTNGWGEKVGTPVTFIEYLTQRAEAYMQEPVNFEGKSQKESGSYGWSKHQTRITHLVEKHLHYSIDSAMKDALKVANSAIATGISETVKIKLAEITAAIKAGVTIK